MGQRKATRRRSCGRRAGCILAAFLICTSFQAVAHEFWIAPRDYSTPIASQIAADLRVRQEFEGTPLSYQPSRYKAAILIGPGGAKRIDGDVGAIPALRADTTYDGLHVLTYASTPSVTSYGSFEDFAAFVREEGLDDALTRHRERGLPERGIRESFTRYAKSLIEVDGGSGEDSAMGMRLELVARTKPYDGAGAQLVTLLFDGVPLEGAQVSVFTKDAEGAITVARLRTDAEGEVSFEAMPGHEYLLNAVRLVEPERTLVARYRALWHSLWASLTFAVPADPQ